MAKREISTTLKNLKFMQRAVQKEEKPKEEEIKPVGKFVSPSNVSRKCVVIMEGDPHPVTIRGRMSFQNFNPSIDKLNGEDANVHEAEASTSCGFQSGKDSDRRNGTSECAGMDMDNADGKHKRKQKQPEGDSQTSHLKKQKTPQGNKSSSGENHSSHKQRKHGKLDWNVLVPSESQSKRKQN